MKQEVKVVIDIDKSEIEQRIVDTVRADYFDVMVRAERKLFPDLDCDGRDAKDLLYECALREMVSGAVDKIIQKNKTDIIHEAAVILVNEITPVIQPVVQIIKETKEKEKNEQNCRLRRHL